MNRERAVTCSTLVAAGLLLATLSSAGVFPIRAAALALSADHALSADFMNSLAHSQKTLSLCLLLVAALVGLAGNALDRLARRFVRMPLPVFLPVLGAMTFMVTLLLQQALFGGIPHVTDATSHLFQARIFAAGKIFAPVPPCPEHFSQHHVVMTTDGKWFTKYTPGHALLLAAGICAHALWGVMPLVTALAAIALAWLGGRFFGDTTGRIAGSLFFLSPLALLLGASFMSHMSSLSFILLAAALFVRAADQGPLRALAAGFFAGWAAIIRPQELAMVAPVALAALCLVPRAARPRVIRLLIPAAIGALPFLAIFMAWNHALYGRCFVIGYGFTPAAFLQPPFQGHFGIDEIFPLRQAVRQWVWTIANFNRALLGWPCSLVFVPFALLPARGRKIDVVCLLGALIPPVVYFFYNYAGLEYEARYYLLAAPFLIVLTARGMIALHDAMPTAVLSVALVFLLHAFVDYWPRHVVPTYAGSYEQASPLVSRLATLEDLEDAVVLIDSTGPNAFRYSSGCIFNDPFLNGPVIYARDLAGNNDCLLDAWPHRKIFRFVPNDAWTNGKFVEVAHR